jgi:hypothetical protein
LRTNGDLGDQWSFMACSSIEPNRQDLQDLQD